MSPVSRVYEGLVCCQELYGAIANFLVSCPKAVETLPAAVHSIWGSCTVRSGISSLLEAPL